MGTLHFTRDWAGELERLATDHESVALLVSKGAKSRGTLAAAEAALAGSCIKVVDDVPPMPDIAFLEQLWARLSDARMDAVVAIGGGSVIDAAKGALLVANCASPDEVAERVRLGRLVNLERSPAILAVPTTAGSGSEVTPFASIWDREEGQKRSIEAPEITPRHAIIDWQLLRTLTGRALLFPALDSLSHSMESLWSVGRSDRSHIHAVTGLQYSIAGLGSWDQPKDALSLLSMASVHAGLAIAESRTAIAHSISYPLSLDFGVPHGLACSFALPAIASRASVLFEANSLEWALIDEAIEILRNFRLKDAIDEYCSRTQVFRCVNRMITPGRTDNFRLPVSERDLTDILAESLN